MNFLGCAALSLVLIVISLPLYGDYLYVLRWRKVLRLMKAEKPIFMKFSILVHDVNVVTTNCSTSISLRFYKLNILHVYFPWYYYKPIFLMVVERSANILSSMEPCPIFHEERGTTHHLPMHVTSNSNGVKGWHCHVTDGLDACPCLQAHCVQTWYWLAWSLFA